MEHFNALPTEQRVKELNKAQYIWLYINIMEEQKRKREEKESEIDYLTYFMDYKLAKAVAEKKKANEKSNSKYEERNVSNANEVYNDDFDAEISKYLENEQFVELPSSDYKYSTESKEEFIERALAFEQLLNSGQFESQQFNNQAFNNQAFNNQAFNNHRSKNQNDINNKENNNIKNNKSNQKSNDKKSDKEKEQLQKDIDEGLDILFIPEDE